VTRSYGGIGPGGELALGPGGELALPRAPSLLHVLMLPDFDRADRIGEF
jgi:hypothetical protein